MSQTVADTILAQLGGNRFIAMTGAKNLVTSGNNLSFFIGTNPKKIAGVRIALAANDTYRVAFLKKAKKDPVFGISVGYDEVKVLEQVHADQLRELFTTHTGLETSL